MPFPLPFAQLLGLLLVAFSALIPVYAPWGAVGGSRQSGGEGSVLGFGDFPTEPVGADGGGGWGGMGSGSIFIKATRGKPCGGNPHERKDTFQSLALGVRGEAHSGGVVHGEGRGA